MANIRNWHKPNSFVRAKPISALPVFFVAHNQDGVQHINIVLQREDGKELIVELSPEEATEFKNLTREKNAGLHSNRK